MSVTVRAPHHLPQAVSDYAEEKVARLSRHIALHDVTVVLDYDAERVPPSTAEVIVRLPHARIAAKVAAGTVQEAIDLVVDKADRRVIRRKERLLAHRAGGLAAQ